MAGKSCVLVTHHFMLAHQHLPYSIAQEYSNPQISCVSVRVSGYQPVIEIGCTHICIRSIQKGVFTPPLYVCGWTEVADLGHRSGAGLRWLCFFGGAGDIGLGCSHGDADTQWTHCLRLRHAHKYLIGHCMTASLDGPIVKKERKTFSLPTVVPQEAHRCWTLLRVTDIIIVQLTTTLILFYQLFIDGH